MDLDFTALVERTLQPVRPRLAEAAAAAYDWDPALVQSWLDASDAPDAVVGAIEAHASPLDEGEPALREAWERLGARGVIPYEWVDHPRRRFAPRAFTRDLYDPGVPEFATASAAPTSLRACVALGGDPEGIAAAEALAVECLRALAPWGERPIERTIWCVQPRETHLFGPLRNLYRSPLSGLGSARSCAHTALLRSGAGSDDVDCQRVLEAIRRNEYERDGPGSALDVAHWHFNDAWLWRVVSERELAVTFPAFEPDASAPAGVRFDELADPFAPLLAIWRLGYALEGLSSDAIVLVAPELEP